MVDILITAILVTGFYKFFELIIRRKERIMMIEKFTPQMTAQNFKMPAFNFGMTLSTFGRFTSLRVGCILLGVGIGLVLGILTVAVMRLDMIPIFADWNIRGIVNIIVTAFVLLFGGVSLIASFIIESRLLKKEKLRDRNNE